jgi:hypothetical protein
MPSIVRMPSPTGDATGRVSSAKPSTKQRPSPSDNNHNPSAGHVKKSSTSKAPVTPSPQAVKNPAPSSSPPTRSARKVKKGVTNSTEVTHVVRVTVLGLAGITVDRSKCHENTKDVPVPPSKMRAVVAFSRNSAIRGTTALSKPLARSPNDDIVLTGSSVKSPKDDDTYTTGTLDRTTNRPQRHVAVWASDNATLGSAVTFEANLQRSSSVNKSTSLSAFAPKSFELTIALTEDDGEENKVALPLGIANVAITGDECAHGHSMKLDLPVLRLEDAKPLGSQGYPMIAIAPKQVEEPQQQQKKKLVQRLFKRNGSKVQVTPKYPTMAARNAFASAYTMDEDGDAIIRVCLEVYERGSELERYFVDRRARDESVSTTASPPLRRERGSPSPYDEAQSTANTTATPRRRNLSPPPPEREKDDGPSDEDEDSSTEYTGTECSSTGHTTETYVSTQDDNIAFFHWNNVVGGSMEDNESMDTDQYTLSFEKKPVPVDDDETVTSFTMFGTRFRIPSCGVMAESDEKNILTEMQDEMTHVTADFFGKSYKVPMCSTFVPKDDDSLTTMDRTYKESTFKDPRLEALANRVSERLCRGVMPKDDFDLTIANTFSTLSEGLISAEFAPAVTVQEYLKNGPRVTKELTPAPKRGDMSIVDYEEPVYTENEESRSYGSKFRLDRYRNDDEELTEKRSTSDNSPKAVTELIPNFDMRREPPSLASKTPPGPGYARLEAMMESPSPKHKKRTPPMTPKRLVDIMNCRSVKCVELDDALRYEPYQTEVPPLIVPAGANGDDLSVGDLTATTHEMHIASEARLLEKARKEYHEVQRRERKPVRMLVPLPVAFGGDGLCIGMGMGVGVDSTASSPIRVQSDDGNSLVMRRDQSKDTVGHDRENYFAEYDELRPATPPKNAESNSCYNDPILS